MRFLYIVGLLLLPGIAFGAGFAKQSLFLSQSTVTEGDTVLIYTVVSNDDPAHKFAGTLVFTDAGKAVGTVPVALAAGKASTVSVSWEPTAGSHTIVAELTDSSGASVGQEQATFDINTKPQPAAKNTENTAAAANAGNLLGGGAVDTSQNIQNSIASFSPVVANTSKPVFSTLDSARVGAAKILDSGIAWSKQQVNNKKTGQVLGASSSNQVVSAGNSTLALLWLILTTTLLYLLSILRYVVANAGIFYPVVAILFLYFLWKMFQRFRRPSYY